MSRFSNRQLRKLVAPLDRSRVQSREVEGREFHYIEGWFAISEANVIFGYDGWDREMVCFERVFDRTRSEGTSCGYMARVRISVRAGSNLVMREGTGFGHALARRANDAHERAIKAAETDATKRALATFGARFGLSLYDREHNADIRNENQIAAGQCAAGVVADFVQPSVNRVFVLTGADGTICAEHLSAESFCGGLRQLVDAARTASDLIALRSHNRAALEHLHESAPMLKSARGEHYVHILERLISTRLAAKKQTSPEVRDNKSGDRADNDTVEVVSNAARGVASSAGQGNNAAYSDNDGRIQATTLAPQLASHSQCSPQTMPANAPVAPNPSRIAPGGMIDKAMLSIPSERRIRNKAHLTFVASKPCLICTQLPSHAHHITFAQTRGLSLKVSDEFTVPLCVVHHNEVHRSGSEKSWWRKHGVDPLSAAQALWFQSCATRVET